MSADEAPTTTGGYTPDPYGEHDLFCESEFIFGAMAWTLCRCEERAEAQQNEPGEVQR